MQVRKVLFKITSNFLALSKHSSALAGDRRAFLFILVVSSSSSIHGRR